MNENRINIILTDDDVDDCMLFSDALIELFFNTSLLVLNNGEELMQSLNNESLKLPDLIFLDLNMRRKNGFDCLSEIRSNEKLTKIPVIIYSTSGFPGTVKQLYKNGANYYIQKPNHFRDLKKIIHKALTLITENNNSQITKGDFLITVDA